MVPGGSVRLIVRSLHASRLIPALLLALGVVPSAVTADFVVFESGQVRPLAMSPNRARVFAVNTPDSRLEILAPTPTGLTLIASVPVGLEPVAVAARSDAEVWVVNHLSDSVSIVDVAAVPPRVVRTLLVGDEPRDIVFGGAGHERAFITTAHRGQNTRVDPQLTTPGVGRADVWVFDADNLGASLGGEPLTIVTLFCDTPRALAVTPDGMTVYAAAFHSGNQTTTVGEGAVCDGGQDAVCEVDGLAMPGGSPAPNVSLDGVPQTEVGLIVKLDPVAGTWEDAIGRDWSAAIRISLPDLDVFAIDAGGTPPTVRASFAHVGTAIFNLAVNPVSGVVYATNTEARNEVRFSGAGTFGGSTVRGHLHEARITVLDDQGVHPRHLNKHIDYDVVASPSRVREASVASPTAMAVSADGSTLYVAAMGSSAIAVYDTNALAADTFVPETVRHIAVDGGGPTGLILDEDSGRLYVLTRFDNAVAVVDVASGRELDRVRLYNPEPVGVVAGRPFLYDAAYTSSNGEASCASCHIFADWDALAWDLSDPDAPVVRNPNPVRDTSITEAPPFHPLKGPLVTQTLRGLSTHGAMHWRGDRTGGYTPGVDPRDERSALRQFNPAFVDLLGRETPLLPAEMDALEDFVLAITPPPNPNRALDNSLTPFQRAGRERFTACTHCHRIDPVRGFLGTDGFVGLTGTSKQYMKVARLDTFYQKVGMFALFAPFNLGDTSFLGDQVRGFGFTHDGSVGYYSEHPDIEAFLLAFAGRLAPIVGQQVTLSAGSGAESNARLDLLRARALRGECDLIAKGLRDNEARGWLLTPTGDWRSDRAAEKIADAALRAHATGAGQAVTFTCVPPGSGARAGVDRDADGFFDHDEIDGSTDPADARSVPVLCAGGTHVAPGRLRLTWKPLTGGTVAMRGAVTLPSAIDPTIGGMRLTVRDHDGVIILQRVVAADQFSRGEERWTFSDPTGSEADGTTAVLLRASSGRVSFKVTGIGTQSVVSPDRLPLQFTLAIGGPGGMQCAASAYAASAMPAACRRLRHGTLVACR